MIEVREWLYLGMHRSVNTWSGSVSSCSQRMSFLRRSKYVNSYSQRMYFLRMSEICEYDNEVYSHMKGGDFGYSYVNITPHWKDNIKVMNRK